MANRLIAALALCLCLLNSLTLRAHAQMALSPCKVQDPELQGTYRGTCANGAAEGTGEAWGIAYYRGEFKAGRKHGKGMKIWPDTGDRYEGTFTEDRKEGTGTYAWGSATLWANERYSGEYLDDQRHGKGVYTWPSGERYEGTWANDQPTGTLTSNMRARINAYVAATTASNRVGIRVCQDRTVGIGVRESIKGTVIASDGGTITVHIEDPGQLGHQLQGRTVTRGERFKEPPYRWKPCL